VPFKLPNFRDKRVQLAAGGAAAVGAFALYRRAHANSAAAGQAAGSVTDPIAAAALDASTIENGIVGDLQPQIDSLSAQLAGLKAGPVTPPVPVPKPKPKAPPKPPKARKPVRHPVPINAALFAREIPLNAPPGLAALSVLGAVGAGGKFTGHNVINGAPVYAILPQYGVAVRGFNAKNLPPGTRLATLKQFAGDIAKPVVRNEQL
jgi:hypothetical protein